MKELDSKFIDAEAPEIDELKGIYRVEMLSGNFLMRILMNVLGDTKTFEKKDNGIIGHNRLAKKINWGYFEVLMANCSVNDLGLDVVEINYKVEENRLSYVIRDHIRKVEDEEYLGRFNLLIRNKLVFCGYFSLKKIPE